MSYRLAIFDFDGTLADTFAWFARVLDQVAGEFGFRCVDAAEREALRACDSREILRRLGVPAWKLPRIAHRVRALKALEAHRLPLFPGVPDMLRHLADRGVSLAIASSDAEANVRLTLGPANAALIDRFACGASLFGKPAKLRLLLERSGVRPQAAIFVGDEVRDAEAARAAGIAFGAVTWGYATAGALAAQAPEHLFASVDELARALA